MGPTSLLARRARKSRLPRSHLPRVARARARARVAVEPDHESPACQWSAERPGIVVWHPCALWNVESFVPSWCKHLSTYLYIMEFNRCHDISFWQWWRITTQLVPLKQVGSTIVSVPFIFPFIV